MQGALILLVRKNLNSYKIKEIRAILSAYFSDSVNSCYSQFLQTDGLFNFNVIVDRRNPENQTQIEVQNDDFVKTVH